MNVLIEVNSFQSGKYSKTSRIFCEIFLRNISIGKKVVLPRAIFGIYEI